MTTESWKLESDLCRCCHSEGKFKNLSEPCKNFGLEERYSDMLKDCFNINLAPVSGLLYSATYTICDGCICRLRDATDFRKQVLACEDRFRDMYDKNVFKVAEPVVAGVKEEPDTFTDADEEFKKESSQDDHDDYDDSLDLNFEEDHKEEVESRKKKKKTKKTEKKRCRTVGRPRKAKQESIEDETEKKKDCTKQTDSYYTLENEEDGSKKYTCTICTRFYKTLASVVQHYRHVHLHLRPKLRSCYLCPIKVPGHVRAFHLEKEHGIPAPTCNACGKKFAYPFQVLRHQKNDHMGEKTFTCSDCPMKFTSAANLAQHAIKHSAIRVHKCEICEKAFKWKKNLRTHIMMHLDERRHVCSVCHEAFVQQTSLKYHITKRHPEMV